jgi:3-deoxy-D-manno-octulosonic-acid transferase
VPAAPRAGRPPIAGAALDAGYGALLLGVAPWAVARACRDSKARARWLAYFRDLPARFGRRARRAGTAPCVWVHGVSVGEVKAAARLVESIEARVPGVEIVITTTTDTGFRVAKERYPGRRVEFYPPDLSWIVRDALDRLRPDLVVLVESEVWPNFLSTVAARGIPVALVNGRISERSASRFRRAGRFVRPLLSSLATVCAQVETYAERFRSMGVAADRCFVTGNLKLDNVPLAEERARSERFARLFGDAASSPLLVAGATHPTEERDLGRIVQRVREAGIPLRAIVAPRHPGRAAAAQADLERGGLAVVRRSTLSWDGAGVPYGPVVLLDTVGELESVYSLADAVFVGGSLLRHGGHNMMEPASLGKPVVVGPHTFNFRGEVDLLMAARGIVTVGDADGLHDVLLRWLREPGEAAAVGRRGREAILASKGATGRTIDVLAPLLDALRDRGRGAPGAGRRRATRG